MPKQSIAFRLVVGPELKRLGTVVADAAGSYQDVEKRNGLFQYFERDFFVDLVNGFNYK